MGKTCEPKAFSFQCMTEYTTNKKKKNAPQKKKTNPAFSYILLILLNVAMFINICVIIIPLYQVSLTIVPNTTGSKRLCMSAKYLQLCLPPCDSVDYSPPGSSVNGILQARIME